MTNRYSTTRGRTWLFALLLPFCFLVNSLSAQTPHITSFSPASGTTGSIVQIHGSAFTGVDAVTFGKVSAEDFIVHSDTLITAHVGGGNSGYVAVYSHKGYDSLAGFVFVSRADTPHILSFTPDSGRTGTVVTITGRHFTGTTAVRFGVTAAAAFTVIADTVIEATVGTGSSGVVTVTNPVATAFLAGFRYIATTVPTHISFFSPTSGTTGTTVQIHGVSFTGTTFVGFGGVSASSFIVAADTLISAVVGAGAGGAVVVSGARGTDSLAGFTYTLPVSDTLHIISFTPDSGSRGTVVTINGIHFTGATSVSFGGRPATSFTVISDTVVDATVGLGASGFVAVANAAGSDSLAGFTYTPPVSETPHILSFTPDSGKTGTIVTINGTHFTGVSAVNFGGTPASSFTVISDSVLDATVGNGSSGFVAMANAAGSDSLAGFVFVDSTGSTDSTDSTPSAHALLLKEYPNPAMGALYVTVPNTTASSKLMLADMNGKVVRTIYVAPNATTVRVNVSGLVKGVYKLVWSDGKHLANQTVLVLNE